MNYCQTQSQAKWQGNLLLQQGGRRKCDFGARGFTLIELLVVTIIVGILAAVSLPNFINQIGKARETEAKSLLGTLARAQEAFHVEKQKFANSLGELNLTASFNPKYYDYDAPTTTTDITLQVKHKASALDASKDRVRNYAVGIYFDNGSYTIIVCQSDEIDGEVDAPDAFDGSCSGGTQIK